jgi:hypothetical protein
MRKTLYTAVALAALMWPATAFAVLQETTVTLTDNGEPLPEATITLNRITDSETPPEPKTETTDDSGKIVIVHDDKDKDSDSTVEIIAKTKEGKTIIRRIILREFLTRETVDVSAPFEPEAEPAKVTDICPNLTDLDDDHLKTMLGNPELRERIVKLIEETKETEETQPTETEKATPTETEKTTTTGSGKSKKTVSRKSKEKKTVQKKPAQPSTASTSERRGPGAGAILGTGLAIGLGIAGSRQGHGGSEHGDHMKLP